MSPAIAIYFPRQRPVPRQCNNGRQHSSYASYALCSRRARWSRRLEPLKRGSFRLRKVHSAETIGMTVNHSREVVTQSTVDSVTGCCEFKLGRVRPTNITANEIPTSSNTERVVQHDGNNTEGAPWRTQRRTSKCARQTRLIR